MAKSQPATDDEQRENVRIAVDEDLDVGEGPHFFSPYPARLVQVKEPETRGGRDVVNMLNEYWPAKIDELEAISREEYNDGYSGSFIRNILRTHYIPEDQYRNGGSRPSASVDDMPEEEEQSFEAGVEEVMEDEEAEWHRVFRYGIRLALEGKISEEEAMNAFNSGFIEGEKLSEEMGISVNGRQK